LQIHGEGIQNPSLKKEPTTKVNNIK
jgi:hypothetical protein